MAPKPAVKFTQSVKDGRLVVKYSVANVSKVPILVFDRLWNAQAGALDPDWAYVDISGSEAVVRRELELLPDGLQFERPPVPYSREVKPGGRATGTIRLDLPLAEAGPYDHIVKRGSRGPVHIDTLKLRIGWCPKPDPKSLPPSVTWGEVGGERMTLLPYGNAARLQAGAESAPKAVSLAGTAVSP